MKLLAPFLLGVLTIPTVVAIQPPYVASVAYSASSPPLSETADNEINLRPWLDSLPEGSVVTFPAGTFPLHRPLILSRRIELKGQPASATTLRGAWEGEGIAVIRVGDYHGDVKVNGVKLASLRLVSAATGLGVHQCVTVHGDDFVMSGCTVMGSNHEGLVISAQSRNAVVEDCIGDGCGLGNESYSLPTAAFNSHAIGTSYKRCKVRRSGHGFEASNTGTTLDDCDVAEPGVSAAGSKGTAYVVGSAGMGVYRLTIKNSRCAGYENAVNVGNGIGRLTEVDIHNNRFDGGTIAFLGGRATNNVPHPDEGPDLSPIGSRIRANTFIVRAETNGLVICGGYPNSSMDELTREKVAIEDNVVYCVGPHGVSPIFSVAGKVTADVSIVRNKILGSAAAPSRGDIATFTNGENPAIPNMPNLTVAGNVAYAADGTERLIVAKIEGSP